MNNNGMGESFCSKKIILLFPDTLLKTILIKVFKCKLSFRLDERLDSEVIEELLFLLSPYVLLRPAQWVLQLLITKHKVSILNKMEYYTRIATSAASISESNYIIFFY